MHTTIRYVAAAVLALGPLAACGPSRAAAPSGEPLAQRHAEEHAMAGAATAARVRDGYTEADVRFMQGMIGHHAQALAMAALVPGRSSRPEMLMMAERIDVSQTDEIAMMRRWLRARGEEVPPPDAHVHAAMGHGALMPGMLTQAELDRLARAEGTEFDRLFLEYMIRHHEGALTMVRELFATPGSGQEPELFVFASDVDADQSAEIRRMRALLASLPGGAGTR